MDFFDFIVDDQNDKSLSGKGERQFETTPLRREENKQVAEEKLLTGLNPEQQKKQCDIVRGHCLFWQELVLVRPWLLLIALPGC